MKPLLHSKGVTNFGFAEKIFGHKFEDIMGNSRKLN
jgi:hypothetical protein